MKIESFKKIKLPNKPGVYFFQKGKTILYIGKATSLRDRVKSYFGRDLINTRGPLLVDMIFKVDKIKWQETDSVLESLILEASFIKKHQPYYNTKEKDDKSFNYVIITKEKLPKVITIRGKELKMQKHTRRHSHSVLEGKDLSGRSKDSSEYVSASFGPFTSGPQLREALKIIRKIFPFLDDKSKNYMEFYRQINLVPDLNDHKLYLQNIRNIKLFFQGKKKEIFRNLKKEMHAYAKAREFEKASEIKRQLFALQHINDIAMLKQESTFSQSLGDELRSTTPSKKQILVSASIRIEAYDIAHMGGKNMVGAMVVLENGEPAKSEYKRFKIRTQDNTNDTGALKEVLERRLAHTEWAYPSLIVVDGGTAQINVTKNVLNKLKVNIPIVSVLKDERHKPKDIMGDKKNALKYKREILLANSEAHRFAIAYHKNMRNKNFLK
ncbi:MAG: UvrB/UvrC motif-containing protein [Patescibacteria group bacterium]|nr:UvrB/UvrC motif-containing protein [Patescibacteria group bacterium]